MLCNELFENVIQENSSSLIPLFEEVLKEMAVHDEVMFLIAFENALKFITRVCL